MVNLQKYIEFCRGLAERIPGIKSAMLVTTEQGMADRIARIPEAETPLLLVLPPIAKVSASNPDAVREVNSAVVFVMQKFNQRDSTAAEVLIESQRAAEEFKNLLIRETARPCGAFSLEPDTIDIMPETEFFASWAGWSIGFAFTV